MMLLFTKRVVVFSLSLIVFLSISISCGIGKKEKEEVEIDEANVLINFIEEKINLINDSEKTPSLILADEVYNNLKGNNYLVIDLRPSEYFEEGHIENSINTRPADILYFFENIIVPSAYEKIVLVCPNGMLSGYINSVLSHLGYDDVFTLRYGLSSWTKDVAEKYWLANLSSHLEGKLDDKGYQMPEATNLPVINTGEESPYKILRERAIDVLEVTADDVIITLDELMQSPEDYYIVNYWPASLYEKGHLPGAIQYSPYVSLAKDKSLTTLPIDKPIVVYCFTAHHSAFVVAYLRLLGYNAYNLEYGANAFIHKTMLETQSFFRSFSTEHIYEFPLVTRGESIFLDDFVQEEEIQVEGGC